MVDNIAIEKLVGALKPDKKDTQSAYMAVVTKKDNDGTVWVQIAGSNTETPVEATSADVKSGDAVAVEWRNNRLYIAGNTSNPSAGVARVINVENAARIANEAASNAVTDAGIARQAAESAQATASAVEGIATRAEGYATEAKASASNASEYASRALGNLSSVQSVTETLNWITAHGAMTLTSDTSLDPTHVYFVADASGDYVVGGNHYSVVSEPSIDDISTYFELSINESLNNYVATHLAVDSEGLWIIPDSGGNKVLIATGQGNTYNSAGTYIVSGSTVLAQFTANGVVIGKNGETRGEIDYHSFKLVDIEGHEYFHISDLRNAQGVATITQEYAEIAYSRAVIYELAYTATDTDYEVAFNGGELYEGWQLTKGLTDFSIMPTGAAPPTDPNYRINVTYTTRDADVKAYTLGKRKSTFPVGSYSFAEGVDVAATEYCSHAEGEETISRAQNAHAEGYRTIASGDHSHAEGMATDATGNFSHVEGVSSKASGATSHAEGAQTRASGEFSHAQNLYTIAQRKSQTAIGEYNKADTAGADGTVRGDYVLIIGNGTAPSTRSNALTVAWTGDVVASGDITDGTGNVLADKADTSSLATVATTGAYSDLSGTPNLATVATSGDYDDLTDKPQINGTTLSGNKTFANLGLVDFFYPVGSYYETSNTSFDPNTVWGGTWVEDTPGRVIVARDTSQTEFDTIGETGGSKYIQDHSHGFTQPKIPNHSHQLKRYQSGITTGSTNRWFASGSTVGGGTDTDGGGGACTGGSVGDVQTTAHGTMTTGNSGNLQPYTVARRWHRIA